MFTCAKDDKPTSIIFHICKKQRRIKHPPSPLDLQPRSRILSLTASVGDHMQTVGVVVSSCVERDHLPFPLSLFSLRVSEVCAVMHQNSDLGGGEGGGRRGGGRRGEGREGGEGGEGREGKGVGGHKNVCYTLRL